MKASSKIIRKLDQESRSTRMAIFLLEISLIIKSMGKASSFGLILSPKRNKFPKEKYNIMKVNGGEGFLMAKECTKK